MQTGTAKIPLWLLPNLLSLDAPLIALLWQDVFARDTGVKLAAASRAALPLAVWLIYLADRLLDTRNGMPPSLTARHSFSCACRGFCYLLAGAVATGLLINIWLLPRPVFENGFLVSCSVAMYLGIVHCLGGRLRSWLPKEAAVGVIFAVGTALAPFTWALDGARLIFPALLFGLLCWINSSAIEIWEGGRADAVSSWAVRHMKLMAAATCIVSVLVGLRFGWPHTAAALIISAIGYWAVADVHAELGTDMLRVAIDVPLLAPLLLMGLR